MTWIRNALNTFARGVRTQSKYTTHSRIVPKDGYRPDLDKNFRSRMEANCYRYLTEIPKGIELVEYEPKIFQLSNGWKYCPDFRITTKGFIYYIEVKGNLDSISIIKIQSFKKDYPELKLYIITPKEYNSIRKLYSKKIKNWEI